MNKKRKVSSPVQAGQGDFSAMCNELKSFIVSENAKCVAQIKETNDRRLGAVEESLTFAMDSIAALSGRQNVANSNIEELKKETEDLKRRLLQFEVTEDRRQQQSRLNTLIFSGPALSAETGRVITAANLIVSLIYRYIKHTMDRAQVKNLVRLRNGKVIFEFTSSAPGSDRDIVYRSRAKLRGSGLFVNESLTPLRQAMFSDLLRLKKEGRIFTVFTRSGDILACGSRDSPPVRVADPETVRRLAGSDTVCRPDLQGRAQAAGRAAPPGPRAAVTETSGDRGRGVAALDGLGESVGAGARRPAGSAGAARRESPPEPRRWRAPVDAGPAGPGGAAERLQSTGSSLLECARESPVHMVHLSPPLEREVASAGGGERSAGGAEGRDSTLGGFPGVSVSPVARPGAASSPASVGDLETPMMVTSVAASPRLTSAGLGELSGRWSGGASGGAAVLPPGERPESPRGSQSVVGSAMTGARSRAGSVDSLQPGTGEGIARVSVPPASATYGAGSTPRSERGGVGKSGNFGSRDIRDFF